MKMVGKVTMQGREFPITVMAKRPNLMLQEMTIDGTRVVSAFDGEKVWVVNPMLGINEPQEMTGSMADEMRDQSIFGGPLVGYKERGETLELVGPEHRWRRQDVEAEADPRKRPDRCSSTWTPRPVSSCSGRGRVDQNGMTVDVDSVMSDYQPTEKGIVVPRTMRTIVGGHQQGLLKVDSVSSTRRSTTPTFQMPKQQ